MQVLAQPAFANRHFNPYNWLLYTQMNRLGVQVKEFAPQQLIQKQPKVWHLHWPELPLNANHFLKAFLKTQAFLWQVHYARLRGIKVVWTVHNLASHSRLYPTLERWFWQAFTRHLDGYISLSQGGLEAAQARFPSLKQLPGFVIPHGHYRGEYPDAIEPQLARTELGIPADTKVILFFGRIRAYKNLPQLVQAFQQLPDQKLLLCIAGMPDESTAEEVKAIRDLQDPRIQLHLDFIAADRAQLYFRAADLVVLPYREILNSGTALLSLSFDRPVLVPMRGAMGELQASVGQEWVKTYDGDLTETDLQTALTWARETPRSAHAPLQAFDWDRIAQQTIAAYATL
jgi:beta-1,4-mannosyltransferase